MTRGEAPVTTVVRQARFWLIGLAALLLAVYVLRGVLLPFVAGMAVAYLLDPVCDRLERWGLSRTWATALVTALFILLAVSAVLLLVPLLASQLASLLERLPDYIEALRGQVGRLLDALQARLDPAMLDKVRDAVQSSAGRIVGWATQAVGRVLSGGVALANMLSLVVITPVVAFYLLRDWDRLIAKIDSWLPREHAETIREQVREVDRTLAGFLRGQGTVCLLLGLFYAIGLTVVGLDFGLVVGLLAGLLSFIPFVGSTVGLLASVGLAVVQFGDWVMVAVVAAIFFAGQAIEGNLLTPKLVGGRVGLHPVWVIFGLLAGGALFGFVGVLLAVPTAAVIGVGARFALTRYMASPYYRGADAADDDAGEGS
jgi:predicted PurR-regulated permease PerM